MKHIINDFLEYVNENSEAIDIFCPKTYRIDQLMEYIPDFLKQYKGGWIPVERELPTSDEGDVVLVTASGKPHKNVTLIDAIEIAMYDDKAGKWVLESYPDAEVTVTAWQPLPESFNTNGCRIS